MHGPGDLLPLKLPVRRANRMLFSALDNDLREGREVDGAWRRGGWWIVVGGEMCTWTALGNTKEVGRWGKDAVVYAGWRVRVDYLGGGKRVEAQVGVGASTVQVPVSTTSDALQNVSRENPTHHCDAPATALTSQ
ncbi:hypothetical protein E2C01_076916 [Portunus trituberculatus]|uniref:Uncharacterized protein n=1 Tax=Portunus trituberculatus TaxID=210409 RepID=A0A5B7IA05_PORTR|nr:hypothetical protein [Portunus trituberculatus]